MPRGVGPWCSTTCTHHLSLTPGMVQELDSDSLPVMVSSLCITGGQQKVYARKVRGCVFGCVGACVLAPPSLC